MKKYTLLNSINLKAENSLLRSRWTSRRPESEAGWAEDEAKLWTSALVQDVGERLTENSTWVVGGDLGSSVKPTTTVLFQWVISALAVHPVRRIVTGLSGLLTVPAISLLVRKTGAIGGILLSPPAGDTQLPFRLTFIHPNGYKADPDVMDEIYERSNHFQGFFSTDLTVTLDNFTSFGFTIDGNYLEVAVLDAHNLYANHLEKIFDFTLLNKLVTFKDMARPRFGFTPLVECISESTMTMAEEVLIRRLRWSKEYLRRTELETWDGEPTAKSRHSLVNVLLSGRWNAGFGLDFHGERAMPFGKKGYEVSPGDSSAVLAAHLHAVPFVQLEGIRGFARTLFLTPAIDKIAKDLQVPLYELPVGEKHLVYYRKNELISLFADEKYGISVGGEPVMDGMVGVLIWLTVVAHLKMEVHEILTDLWRNYGRFYSARLELSGLRNDSYLMLEHLESSVTKPEFFGTKLGSVPRVYTVLHAESFSYYPPSGGAPTERAGLKIRFECGSRVVCRHRDSRSHCPDYGTRLLLYLDHYAPVTDQVGLSTNPFAMVTTLLSIFKDISKIDIFCETYQEKTL